MSASKRKRARARRAVCSQCGGAGGPLSKYGPPPRKLADGRLVGWTIGGKKNCGLCSGTGFVAVVPAVKP